MSSRFARMPHALAAPGLFRSYSKQSQRPVINGELARREHQKVLYVFSGQSPLGTDDLRVIQAIFILASDPMNRYEVDLAAPSSNLAGQLALALAFTGNPAESRRSRLATASLTSLAVAGGYSATSGGGKSTVKNALARLANVTLTCHRDGNEVSCSKLIAFADFVRSESRIGNAHDKIAIAIAPALSGLLLGQDVNQSHIRIAHEEICGLGEGSDRILHLRLCGMVNQGASLDVSAGKLAEYAFGEANFDHTARRQLSESLPTALESLRQIGWTVVDGGGSGPRQKYTFSRPASKYQASES